MAENYSYNSKPGLPSAELLDDLCSRFLINVPDGDLKTFERILFVLENAYWYYEDNIVDEDPNLKSLSFKQFTSLMFNYCPLLRPYIKHLDAIHKHFSEYKSIVPVFGAVILDETLQRCLLVKGWKGGSCWGFPRGKRCRDEEDSHVAIREVEEETGLDLRGILREKDFVETTLREQHVRLYIVTGIKADIEFAPRTKKEIREIAWFRLDELEPYSECIYTRSVIGLKLFFVAPFLEPITSWINRTPRTMPISNSKAPFQGSIVWKAKNNTSDDTSVPVLLPESKPDDNRPGTSFRDFRFDTGKIMQAMEFEK